MTKEQILEKSFNTLLKAKFGAIVGEFSEANTNNGYEWVFTAMEEYKEQEVAKEREKAKKLVEALEQYTYLDLGLITKLKYTPKQRLLNAQNALTEYEK